MKTLKKLRGLLLLLPLVGGWGATSCSLFPEPDPTLPPATQTGANTFGCLINGKIFVAKEGAGQEGIIKSYDGRMAIFARYTNNNKYLASLTLITPFLNGVGRYIFDKPNDIWYAVDNGKSLWDWYGKKTNLSVLNLLLPNMNEEKTKLII